MKANEVEKLYLHPTANGKIGASWLTFPLTNEDIEYTRTDAFIEKALRWFEQNLHMYNTAEALGDRQCFIKDFRKYMEE